MNKSLLKYSIVTMLLCFPGIAYAEKTKPTWLKKFNIESQAHNCQGMWDVIWPEFKNGNNYARATFLMYAMPMMHTDKINMPGKGQDLATRTRDLTILAVHNYGLKFEDETVAEDYKSAVLSGILYMQNWEKFRAGQKFLQCIKKTDTSACPAIAVEENLVPTMESFISEIDTAIVNGAKPSCIFFDPHDLMSHDSVTNGP